MGGQKLEERVRVVKSSPQVYDVKCIRDDCPFRVHAYMGKYDTFWSVSRIEHHTCILEELEVQHRNLTADFVAQHMYSKIVNNPGYEPKSIINSIDDDFQYKISYGKAYGAKREGVGNEMGNADDIGVGATEYEIARHLEAYVLWLMGWVMFCSSAGSFVPKHLLRFARYVADAPLEAIPQFSWGSAVLAATYRGLCTGYGAGTTPRIATELPGRHPVHKE
ncbi:hypothetical protein U9M48_040623 [Paspalum notatum var. saurae]|uniref:Transposase MuDR plant domain-containing protein n=1 Tax=Paspalum notatum var. saurae TaxID=547442 RepID=A0AAQ3USR4_PASNO